MINYKIILKFSENCDYIDEHSNICHVACILEIQNRELFFGLYIDFPLSGCPSPGYYGANCQDGCCGILEGTPLTGKPGYIDLTCTQGKRVLQMLFS